MLSIQTGKGIISDSKNVPPLTTDDTKDLSVVLADDAGAYDMLIMYDLDAPYPHARSKSPYLHLLVTNITGGDIRAGSVNAAFLPPNPPSDSSPHRYVISLYRMRVPATPFTMIQRENFNVEKFVQDNATKLLGEIIFTVGPAVPAAQMIAASAITPSLYSNPASSFISPITPYAAAPPASRPDSPESPRRHYHRGSGHADWFRADSKLTEGEKDYCSCVLKVASKQGGKCNLEKAWFEERDGRTCYNPYAVCAAVTHSGTGRRGCGEHYNFANIPEAELEAFANLHGISIPSHAKEATLRAIEQWKAAGGK